MRVLVSIFLLSVMLLSCKNKKSRQETILPLISFYDSHPSEGPFHLEFNKSNSVRIHHYPDVFKLDTVYSIDTADQQKLDSFLQVLIQIKTDESYFEPLNGEIGRSGLYRISIQTDSVHKTVEISGSTAPPKFYAFAFWASSLKTKLENKKHVR